MALRPIAPVAAFLLTPGGLATAIVVIIAAALPWFRIPAVLDAFRTSILQAIGVACYLLVLDLLALTLILSILPTLRANRRFWRIAAGCQGLGLFFWGFLGAAHPDTSVAGVSLREVSAGGHAGHALVASPLGLLVWLAALASGFALITPSGAMGLVRQLPPAGQALLDLNLPGKLLRLIRHRRAAALASALVAPDRAPVAGAAGFEPEPPVETIGQGAADAFLRAGERERKAKSVAAPVAEPAPTEPSEPPAPVAAVPDGPPLGRGWLLPGTQVLAASPPAQLSTVDNEQRAKTIVATLASFGVDAKVVQVNQGPTVTQFGVEPGWDIKTRTEAERGADGKVIFDKDGKPRLRVEEVSRTRVRVNQITKLQNDLALALAAQAIRIEAPVPGKPVVGIEVPNTSASVVSLRSVVESPNFQRLGAKSKIALALGMGVSGEAAAADLAKMPHLLIAGSTGSGKSVCINAIIACILMHATPDEVRFVLIDPKRVEMTAFESIPHLALSKIITDMEDVPGTLQGVIMEMDARYKKFELLKVRNLEAYNKHPKVAGKLPQWVVIIDELADLMMAGPIEVERQICRLAQLARATGIHLVVATQRPSVDVITGLIKANFPTRIAFAVSSQVDSRTILDSVGAEKLLGRGDMLFVSSDEAKPRRLQGVWVSDQEIERLVEFWGAEKWEHLRPQTFDHLVDEAKAQQAAADAPEKDELLDRARELATLHTRISASMLQRRLKIGYPRAARLLDSLEDEGIIASGDGTGSRDVIGSDDDSIFGDL
ncbi:MAG: DNA translocase FtsK [Dehalococcoidia bacterium]